MIKHLKYHEIDFEKYSECINLSEQYKYSATSFFLDITTAKQWELLIYNDYEAVMPVPFVMKYGFKVVINPHICQQLGVFSIKDSKIVNDAFFDFLNANFNVWYYPFNDCNLFSKKLPRRKNYLIPPAKYDEVRENYSPKRIRKLRWNSSVENKFEIRDVNFLNIKPFIEKNSLGIEDEKAKKSYLKTLHSFSKFRKIDCKAFYKNGEILNVVIVYKDDKATVLLGTINDRNNMKYNGSSILIDRAISENIELSIFDFEGSEQPNVEEFFRGFRPHLRTFPYISNSKKMVMLNFFKLNLK